MNRVSMQINDDVLQTFPEVNIAAVKVDFPADWFFGSIPEELESNVASRLESLQGVEKVTDLVEIKEWRAAYGILGVKPSKYHSSIESLLRRLKKGQEITTGLPIVDFYNMVSLAQMAPIGAYDLQKIRDRNICLRKADPSKDHFQPLNANSSSFPLSKSLAVYAVDEEILCWGFNVRDSLTSCVTETTRSVLFCSEAVSDHGSLYSINAMNQISQISKELGSIVGNIVTLTAKNKIVDL